MNIKNDFLIKIKSQLTRFKDPILYRFLNPEEQELVQNIFKSYYVKKSSNNREYQRLFVSDSDEIPDFKITYLKTSYSDSSISHRDILGALMQLGLERNTFGDIYLQNNFIYIEVMSELVHIFLECHQIKGDSIYFEIVDSIPEIELKITETKTIFVDSPRMDNVIAKSFNIKREIVQVMIEGCKVKINYKEVLKYTILVKPYDIISVRGFGRLMISDDFSLSKSSKQRITINIMR